MKHNEHEIGAKVRILNNYLKRRADAEIIQIMKKYDSETLLSGSNMYMLGFIGDKAKEDTPVYQKDIEKRMGITKSAVSRSLDLLESKGMIHRTADAEDSRKKKILPDQKVYDIGNDLTKSAAETENCLMKGFSEEEKAQLLSFMERMIANMKEIEEGKE